MDSDDGFAMSMGQSRCIGTLPAVDRKCLLINDRKHARSLFCIVY